MNNQINTGKIVIYQTDDGQASLEVNLTEDTVWLSLNQMAALFDRDKSVVSRHIHSIFKEGELEKKSTVAKNETVQIYRSDGTKRIADNALVALTLMIAMSDPKEKERCDEDNCQSYQ